MTIPIGEVFVDTNVLLALTDRSRPCHRNAQNVFSIWPASGAELVCSGQTWREYHAVATRPLSGNGLGLSSEQALSNATQLRGRLRTLDETGVVADRFHRLLREVPVVGRVTYDAHLVATMLVHQIPRLATANAKDFVRFSDLIEVIDVTLLG